MREGCNADGEAPNTVFDGASHHSFALPGGCRATIFAALDDAQAVVRPAASVSWARSGILFLIEGALNPS
jgi:hypothetical protein